MNYLERLCERLVGYRVDWDATGTWAGALATALAVFVAAGLTDFLNRKAHRDRRAAELEVVATVYRAVYSVLEDVFKASNAGRIVTAAYLRSIDDLLVLLNEIPLLQMPNERSAEDLVVVRRLFGHARDEVAESLRTSDQFIVTPGHEHALKRVEVSAERLEAAARGLRRARL